MKLAGAAIAVLGLGSCEREAMPAICPDVQAGELVLTEMRGPQSGADTYGQWFELFNTSGAKQEPRRFGFGPDTG